MLNWRVSVANVATELARFLSNTIPNTGIVGFTGSTFLEPALQPFHRVNPEAPVGIFCGVPDQVRSAMRKHPFSIGVFVCETDRIHPFWVDECNLFDLIVVPSAFCQQAFVNSGVTTPVVVIPHGLEPEYQPVSAPRYKENKFVFYNTFSSANRFQRKGGEELVSAFLKAFEGHDDVVLRLRSAPGPALVDIAKRYQLDPLIELDTRMNIDTAEFARIYSAVDCTVHPSRGEGFGLIPFQSIACETPVIAPATSGMADYLNDENAILLRTLGNTEAIGGFLDHGAMQIIDEQHLVECLRYVYSNQERELQKVKRAGPAHRKRYRWETVLSPLGAFIEAVLGSYERGETPPIREFLENQFPNTLAATE